MRPDAARLALWLAVTAGIALPILTIWHVPTPSADANLYASIARARQLYGVGVPTVHWNSPAAVDHIPFYGPVFFDLTRVSLDLFGVSLVSLRLVTLLGTMFYVLGTVILAREFSGSPRGPLLAAALVLLSAEVNTNANDGTMHMLAIGFEVMAMATFATKFDRRRHGAWRGGIAGLFLGLAFLTTPRSYPFVFAFVCAGLIPALFASATKAVRHRLYVAVVTLGAIFLVWSTAAHGSPVAWARYMAYIASQVDTDVAVLATSVRIVGFHWSGVPTALAIIVGSFVMARSVSKPGSGREEGARGALVFLLACTWIQLVATTVVINYTFANSEYILLPIFAVLVSWPRVRVTIPATIVATAVTLLLAADAGLIARRYLLAAMTWNSLDSRRIYAFIKAHVPPGSTVIGPEEPFFISVERAGSRYRTPDLGRWGDLAEPGTRPVRRPFSAEPAGPRFLFWIDGVPLKEGYECAAAGLSARYEAPPARLEAPRWVRRTGELYTGYPTASLYRLPDGCPSGYDPTRPPSR